MKSSKKSWIQLLILSVSLSGLYFLFHTIWLPIAGLTILILSSLSRSIREKILFSFDRLMRLIGKFKTLLIMTFTFYVLLFPIALLYQLFKRKIQSSTSNFEERNHQVRSDDLVKMW